MSEAAGCGHKEIVQMMLGFGANDYNNAMFYTAKGGHKKIVQMMLDFGANKFDWAMAGATDVDIKK
jgi:uncharacterized protein